MARSGCKAGGWRAGSVATDPARQPPALQPLRATPYLGYGYQFWLLPLKERTFVMQGVYGQAVYVQPSSGIVMVQTAVWPDRGLHHHDAR